VRIFGGEQCNGWTGFVVIQGMGRVYFILFALVILGQGCSKHHDDNNLTVSGVSGTVFVAGSDGTNPTLWVDGQARTLATDGGYADRVILDGNDVYVAGISNQGPYANITPAGPSGQYGYWKNGVLTAVGPSKLARWPAAIAVEGNDVYFSSGPLYKNGTLVSLPGLGQTGAVVWAMAVGGDVYLAGRDSIGDGVYWKNGDMHLVAATQSLGPGIQFYCMYVSNGDVYIGGSDVQDRGVIWKNGVANVMPSPLWDVIAVFVDGSDVYSISHVLVNGNNIPAYWKNGVQVNLSFNGATYGNASSIFVSKGNVYVTGYTSRGAVLWKNGVETLLSSSGEAYSVVVR